MQQWKGTDVYLVDELLQPTDLGIRSRLWSASTSSLPVRCIHGCLTSAMTCLRVCLKCRDVGQRKSLDRGNGAISLDKFIVTMDYSEIAWPCIVLE